jgi:hypothetical protein
LPFDVYVALDPPVNLEHAMLQLDRFYNAPLVFPEAERSKRIDDIFGKVLVLSQGELDPGMELPFTQLEAEFLIGLSFRMDLQYAILQTQDRHDLGVLRTHSSRLRRAPAFREASEYGFMEYMYAFVLRSLAEHAETGFTYDEESAQRMFASCDLRAVEAELACERARARIRQRERLPAARRGPRLAARRARLARALLPGRRPPRQPPQEDDPGSHPRHPSRRRTRPTVSREQRFRDGRAERGRHAACVAGRLQGAVTMHTIEKTVEVGVPVRTAYNQWTQFEEFPRFMRAVRDVQQLDDKRLHWRAVVLGQPLEWTAEITHQVPDRRICWRSTAGIANSGSVSFQPLSSAAHARDPARPGPSGERGAIGGLHLGPRRRAPARRPRALPDVHRGARLGDRPLARRDPGHGGHPGHARAAGTGAGAQRVSGTGEGARA